MEMLEMLEPQHQKTDSSSACRSTEKMLVDIPDEVLEQSCSHESLQELPIAWPSNFHTFDSVGITTDKSLYSMHICSDVR